MRPIFNISWIEAILIVLIIGFILALGGCITWAAAGAKPPPPRYTTFGFATEPYGTGPAIVVTDCKVSP